MSDFLVSARSDDELDREALRFREEVGVGTGEAMPNLLAVLEKAPLLTETPLAGLLVSQVPDEQMNDAEAYVTFNPPHLFVRSSIWQGLLAGRARDRMTIAHELAHIWLGHVGEPKFRMASGNKMHDFIPAYKSAEHQAKRTASSFLMPAHLVRNYSSSESVSQAFGVSLEAARVRLDQIGRSGARKLPAEVVQLLDQIKNSSKGIMRPHASIDERIESSSRNLARVWDRAAVVDGKNPSEFRLCSKGILVAWSHYLKPRSELGWCEKGGVVRSYSDLKRFGLENAKELGYEDAPCPNCGSFSLTKRGVNSICDTCRKSIRRD